MIFFHHQKSNAKVRRRHQDSTRCSLVRSEVCRFLYVFNYSVFAFCWRDFCGSATPRPVVLKKVGGQNLTCKNSMKYCLLHGCSYNGLKKTSPNWCVDNFGLVPLDKPNNQIFFIAHLKPRKCRTVESCPISCHSLPFTLMNFVHVHPWGARHFSKQKINNIDHHCPLILNNRVFPGRVALGKLPLNYYDFSRQKAMIKNSST